jgi:outer membrane protein assembly factor BamE (lipoprotein component of BamABCDE complex)
LAKLYSKQFIPMKKKAPIINSILALAMLTCLTSHATAGRSITQAKIDQIRLGQTTEADLVRTFGPPATKMVCPPEEMSLDWFYVSPISAQNYIPVIGPALGGTQVKAWELWIVLRANGTVRRYIAYGHLANGQTKRYIERSDYPAETGKNVQIGRRTDLSRSDGRNQTSSQVVQGGW